jgi:hypothetical protein
MTYRKEIVVIPGTTVHVSFDVLVVVCIVVLLVGCLLLVATAREGFIFAVSKLLDEHSLLLFANNELTVDDLLDEPSLVLQLAVIGVVDTQPVFLYKLARVI